jgi:hypothetical protein
MNIKDKNILKAIEPTKIFFKEFGQYPKIWQIKAINNISSEQAKEVIKLAKQNVKGLVGYLNN